MESLDSVVWEQPDVPKTLRLLAAAGPRATEEDCYPLFDPLATREGRPTSPDAVAALPFVVALAADPAMGARITLLELLAFLRVPALDGADWTAAWALLADPDPAVRRAATDLAPATELLLERWRVEPDPTVRIPLLLALGAADPSTAESRAVLADALTGNDGDDPVFRLAAVHASARLDPDLPVRQLNWLVELFADPALRPRFEEVWYAPGVYGPWTREHLVTSTARLLAHAPGAQLAFAVRLVAAADRTGDAALCREALDLAWRLLTERRSVAAALLPLAGGLLADPDPGVRLRAVNILAALAPASAPYADGLAALLGDDGADEFLDGSIREYARWALTRIGDPRALPGLVAQLRAQAEEQGRGYVIGEPRRPEIAEVLIPLRAHADVLLPEIRAALREGGPRGSATREFLEVLTAWGEDALPALPELVPLLADTLTSMPVVTILRTLGPAAASAAPALRDCQVLDHPGNHELVAATAAAITADPAAVEEPDVEQLRLALESTVPWTRIHAASALWSATGRSGPSLRVLEEFVTSVADGGDHYGSFRDALEALIRIGGISPAIRAALLTVRQSERRLCSEGGYPMVLKDGELRALVEQALAGADAAG